MKPLAVVLLALATSAASAADLTAVQVRALLAQAGINPGTSRPIGGWQRTLTAVKVVKGKAKGDYIIRVHVASHLDLSHRAAK